MPEIGEIARIVHYLKKHVVNRTIASILTTQDDIVYGKVGCSHTQFEKSLAGKRVLDARQQGKYFWLVMDTPPHPLMHFGMTGWIKFSNDTAAPYTPGSGKAKKEEDEWPPKYMKFVLKMAEEGRGECEVAFVDPRRLARIRLVDCEAGEMRDTTPLKENGPDPVVDREVVTKEWLDGKLKSKKVPVKALLLDQANISGVGNWVADEILYQAKIHPEQYSNTFSATQTQDLHDSLIRVCTTACETLADSSQFPENWLMKHRWNKGKKDANVLPNGNKIIHLKVGGRTSAVVPAVQKKTGPVAGDVEEDEADEVDAEAGEDEKPMGKGRAKKGRVASKKEESNAEDGDEVEEREKPKTKPKTKKAKTALSEKQAEGEEPEKVESKPDKSRKRKAAPVKHESSAEEEEDEEKEKAEAQGEVEAEDAPNPPKKAATTKNSLKKEPKPKPNKTTKVVKERTVGGRRSGRGAAATKSYREVDDHVELGRVAQASYHHDVWRAPRTGIGVRLSKKQGTKSVYRPTINGNVIVRRGKSPRSLPCSKSLPQQTIAQRRILPIVTEDVASEPRNPLPTLVWADVEGPGMHYRAPPTTSPAKYYCTKPSCKAEFRRAHDWKKHEQRVHEQCEIWKCPDCLEEFSEATRFRTHHRVQHDCALHVSTNCQHSADAHQVLLRKVAWGCGFCGLLQTTWDARCSHVIRHFASDWYPDSSGKGVRGRGKHEWDVSLEIRSLLEREELSAHLETILAQTYPIKGQHGEELGNMLRWSPDEIEEAETQSLILRLQCPILPEDGYGIVYRLVVMTLPHSAWDGIEGRMKDNQDCFDRDIQMLSVSQDFNSQVGTRMPEFEQLDWELAKGLGNFLAGGLDEYDAWLYGWSECLHGPESQFGPFQSGDGVPDGRYYDEVDMTSNLPDILSLNGPLFREVAEDMCIEADFNTFINQHVLDD
ncbi:hypothetical protein FKW77_002042 [Venturia effusa]|uniref:Uncharacterized protein n=1 Tax=Venturia effusa TaxID=50376 RepID=A0A517LEX2_9PEZI|nr:hypothetical protein FKW77_002042 [Venturia effusa]